ncbi:MAG: PAN domain-containing protein [Pseudomonadota bacterium]
MRTSIIFAAIIGLSAAAVADEHDYSHEQQTYRHGGTYEIVSADDANACASACEADGLCKAWSFQRETSGLGPARCELKSAIGKREENALMVSGISPRYSNYGIATPDGKEKDELLGASAAGINIPSTQPIITSGNARVVFTSSADFSVSAIR